MAIVAVNTDTKHFLTGMTMPLIDPEMLVEIEAVARMPRRDG